MLDRVKVPLATDLMLIFRERASSAPMLTEKFPAKRRQIRENANPTQKRFELTWPSNIVRNLLKS